jgi:hypothetical protein
VNFTNVTIRDLNASDWQFRKCVLKNTSVSLSKFGQSSFDVNLIATEFDSCEFNECNVQISGETWNIRHTNFRGGMLKLGGAGRLASVEMKNSSDVVIESDLKLMTGTKVTFRECTVIARSRQRKQRRSRKDALIEDSWYDTYARVNFESCILGGVWLDPAHILALIEKPGWGPSPPVVINDGRGIVMTTDPQGNIKARQYEELKKRFPNVVFCCVFDLDDALRRREKYFSKEVGNPLKVDEGSGLETAKLRFPLLHALETTITSMKLSGKVDGLLAQVVENNFNSRSSPRT